MILHDYSQHLDATNSLLQQIRDACTLGDISKVTEIAQTVDWEAVTSEFETVTGRYRCAVYRHGRRIIRNLRRPYMLYHDCVDLQFQVNMLRGAIKDSPSLLTSATAELERAYQAALLREILRGHKTQDDAPATLPWTTIEALIDAANEKIQRGRELSASGNPDYFDGRRVYPERFEKPDHQ